MSFDPSALRDEFRLSNLVASQRARWCADDPGAEPNTCRYCGLSWRRWFRSQLDGHAACIVTEDFKQRLVDLFEASPSTTFAMVATAIGVSAKVVRSWTFPITRTRAS